jgi:hypothetical protein
MAVVAKTSTRMEPRVLPDAAAATSIALLKSSTD